VNYLLNPYLDKLKEEKLFPITNSFMSFNKRQEYVLSYSWAIPTEEVIQELLEYSPLVEMGAGGGYWSYLIDQMGGDIIAYDKAPHYNSQSQCKWYEVHIGEEEVLTQHYDRTLFLCWPPYDNLMAYNSLKNYKGDTLIYIGESNGGCTGEDNLFKLLEKEWSLYKELSIPTWGGVYDMVYIYKRS
jgi:hypothetical protein